MKPYIKSDFVDERGKLGSATRIPPKSEGGAVTAADIVAATGTASEIQAEQIRQNLGAESSRFEVSITKRGSAYVADKTYAQILAAHQAGKLVVFCFDADVSLAAFVPGTGGQDDAFVAQFAHSYPTPAITMIAVPSSGVVVGAITAIEAAQKTVTASGTTPTITPAANTVYNCGELTSLTISNPPAIGNFWIWFTSGATPTTVTGIDNFTPEANKVYRISVENGYATYDSWSVGGGS
jgi:hypothetical protein